MRSRDKVVAKRSRNACGVFNPGAFDDNTT